MVQSLNNSKLSISLALWKCFDEILVNAIDRNSLFPNDSNSISVLVDQENGIISIEIMDLWVEFRLRSI